MAADRTATPLSRLESVGAHTDTQSTCAVDGISVLCGWCVRLRCQDEYDYRVGLWALNLYYNLGRPHDHQQTADRLITLTLTTQPDNLDKPLEVRTQTWPTRVTSCHVSAAAVSAVCLLSLAGAAKLQRLPEPALPRPS